MGYIKILLNQKFKYVRNEKWRLQEMKLDFQSLLSRETFPDFGAIIPADQSLYQWSGYFPQDFLVVKGFKGRSEISGLHLCIKLTK